MPAGSPSQDSGIIITQGMANGSSDIPDSPESPGFLTQRQHAGYSG